MHGSGDTIVAIATAAGRGGVGIIRVSGPRAHAIAAQFSKKKLVPRLATFGKFRDANGEIIDDGLLLFFPAPNSFTGEAVLELQVHGSPIALNQLLNRCVELGARLAQPGEFSQRAFLNHKIDLTQAEAIADLISAQTVGAARAAVRSLQGEFSSRVASLQQKLIHLRVYIEAALDFPEEEIDFLADPQILQQASALEKELEQVSLAARCGQRLRDGLHLVILGQPNAGKSSLLNALAGHDRAIVTAQAGTTRDVLREALDFDGLPVQIVDTAGIRDTFDPIEREGVRRALAELEHADHALLLVDACRPNDIDSLREKIPASMNHTTVYNKCDLLSAAQISELKKTALNDSVFISAKMGSGLDALRSHIRNLAGISASLDGTFSARTRHLIALERTTNFVNSAKRALSSRQAELAADDLRRAQDALSEITGEHTADDLLGAIFGSFCIGK
jgi:tRNA modification GTPase